MMMKVIIDRFEQNIAIVELDGEFLHAPRALFEGAQEGDTVEITVLPKGHPGSPDNEAHALFEKLRRKRRQRDGRA